MSDAKSVGKIFVQLNITVILIESKEFLCSFVWKARNFFEIYIEF